MGADAAQPQFRKIIRRARAREDVSQPTHESGGRTSASSAEVMLVCAAIVVAHVVAGGA